MGKCLDLSDFENDNFKVIGFEGKGKHPHSRCNLWRCLCKHCGNEHIISASRLNLSYTKSCGCLNRFGSKGSEIHDTSEYVSEV